MGFVKVADTSELTSGSKKKIFVGDKVILLSNVDGSYYAISDKCPHMGGSLGEGVLKDGIITCPKHGAKFDVKTGKAVGEAKMLLLKIKVKDSAVFPLKIDGSDIFVEID